MLTPLIITGDFLAAFIMFFFSITVIRANPKSWRNRSFFIYLMSKGATVFINSLIFLSSTLTQCLFLCNLLVYSMLIFPSYLFLFGLSFFLKDVQIKKAFFLLTFLTILIILYFYFFVGNCIVKEASYGCFYTSPGLPIGLTYHIFLEGGGIFLLLLFSSRIITKEIRKHMWIMSLVFLVHFSICGSLIVVQRVLNTSEFDMYWPLIDVILFGIALRSFLRLSG